MAEVILTAFLWVLLVLLVLGLCRLAVLSFPPKQTLMSLYEHKPTKNKDSLLSFPESNRFGHARSLPYIQDMSIISCCPHVFRTQGKYLTLQIKFACACFVVYLQHSAASLKDTPESPLKVFSIFHLLSHGLSQSSPLFSPPHLSRCDHHLRPQCRRGTRLINLETRLCRRCD